MNGKSRMLLAVASVVTVGAAMIGGSSPALAGASVAAKVIHFPGPKAGLYGRSVTLAATGAGGTAPVVFSLDAGSGAGVCAVSGTNGSTLTYTGVGSCVLDANQAASPGFPSPPPVQRAVQVSAAPLQVTFGRLTRRYGQNITAPVRYVGLVNGDTPATVGAGLVVTITSVTDHSVSAASASTPVGNYVVTGSGISGNYVATYVAGSLTVNPVPLRITVERSARIVGQPDPVFPVTYAGFVNGDSSASLGGSLSFKATLNSTVSSPTSPPGNYTVHASGVTSNNYAISYITGTMRVLASFPTNIIVSNQSVAENQPAGTAIGTLSASDPVAKDTKTFTLVAGTGDDDNTDFQIVGTTLETNAAFDFETRSAYTIRVRVTETHGLTYEQAFPITITNVNEAPTAIALDITAVAEGLPIGTTVGTLSDTDPDAGDTATYTLAPGAGDTDNAAFGINGTTLQTNAVFNYATQSSYSILVQVTDSGGLNFTQHFTITITPAPLTLSMTPSP